MECSIEWCDRVVLATGLCKNHYQQARSRRLKMATVHGPCQFCGGPIAPAKNKNAVFCSIQCKQKAIDARRAADILARKTSRPRLCGWCQEVLDPRRPQRTRFCSSSCSDHWQNNAKAAMAVRAKKAARRPCELCGGPIPPERRHGALYCSNACKALGGRSKSPAMTAKQRDANLMRLYGINAEQRDALLSSQGSVCAICSVSSPVGKGWHVDHDHDSGRVRGVLCHRCNLMLGNAKDSPALLRSAADYLERVLT